LRDGRQTRRIARYHRQAARGQDCSSREKEIDATGKFPAVQRHRRRAGVVELDKLMQVRGQIEQRHTSRIERRPLDRMIMNFVDDDGARQPWNA
jgi:hypothetical protein